MCSHPNCPSLKQSRIAETKFRSKAYEPAAIRNKIRIRSSDIQPSADLLPPRQKKNNINLRLPQIITAAPVSIMCIMF
jgi:hypothetical protein